jgi:hypothetical protein
MRWLNMLTSPAFISLNVCCCLLQLPVSPRAVPPPMSPSQRRVGFDLGSALNSEPGLGEAEGGIPTQHEVGLS